MTSYELKNFILKNKFKNLSFYNSAHIPRMKYIDTKLIGNCNLYINLKNSDGLKYINKRTKDKTLFINTGKFIFYELKYEFLTINSLNPLLSDPIKIDGEERFNEISQIINFENSYKINSKGPILICLNNFNGWYSSEVSKIKKKLLNLCLNIRKFNKKNGIILKFHPKNYLNDLKLLNDTLRYINNNLKGSRKVSLYDNSQNSNKDIFLKSYCVFIQNSKFILELVMKGIPVYNHNISKVNSYDKIFLKNLRYLKNLKKYKKLFPDRKDYMKEQLKHLYLRSELKDDNISSKIADSIN